MSHVSGKLSGSVEGALAGGGDPASSPLYVFGPFLKLLVTAGALDIAFGASVWLAVFTVATISAMYRLVMTWVTDGSGGSGLNEEEFGSWAVKVNAGITVIEYTLTFLVSIAALVTFVADRVPALGGSIFGVPLRTLLAVCLCVATGALVNRGPRIAARAFGPATAAVLLLLWVMIVASVLRFGVRLPSIHPGAFSREYSHVTLGGYARILALMTGIEMFANLVAAYDGPAKQRSQKAFGSLVIVMGTTCLTMLVVGPAIRDLANPLDPDVSVFTQTLDKLLPRPVADLGTLIGVAVLLSAAAASAQGIQNLALGLRYRHYIPAGLGKRNRFEVADRPVWLEVSVCVACFVAFGTREETYLALYAAGVFVLLSLTGWAAVKRLGRELRAKPSFGQAFSVLATAVAALLATLATGIIFDERFREGAWSYFLLVPVLYVAFGAFRRRLGPPPAVADRLGRLLASSCLSPPTSESLYAGVTFSKILIPLDRSPFAEQAIPVARTLGQVYGSTYSLLTVVEAASAGGGSEQNVEAGDYLARVAQEFGSDVSVAVVPGNAAQEIGAAARRGAVDTVVMATRGNSGLKRWLSSGTTSEVIYQTTPPLIVVRPTDAWQSTRTRFARLLVALDGSEVAEQVIPFVHGLAARFKSEVVLFSVAEGAESDDFVSNARRYLEGFAGELTQKGIATRVVMETGAPARAILRVTVAEKADLIMMVSHGRGGVERQDYVRLGSVAAHVVQECPCPVFLVSARDPGAAAFRPENRREPTSDPPISVS